MKNKFFTNESLLSFPLIVCRKKRQKGAFMNYIFFGAGMSITSGLPTAGELANIVNSEEEFKKDEFKNLNIYEIADWCEKAEEAELKERLKQIIAASLTTAVYTISPEYRMMTFLIKKGEIKVIYTTNQDSLLETILDEQGISYNRYTYLSDKYNKNINNNLDIIKLHGDIHNPSDMCFSKDEIIKAAEKPIVSNLIEKVKSEQFLFIGYSFYKDTLSNGLVNSLKTGNSIIVDLWLNKRHKEIVDGNKNNKCFELSVEDYLEKVIRNIKPEINVRHILFNKKSVGGVQTYYESLRKICIDEKVPINFSAVTTEDYYFDPDINKEEFDSYAFGISYLQATAMSRTYESIADNNRVKNKEDGIDIIHAHDFITAHHASEMNFPVIYTSHSLQSTEDEIEKKNKLRSDNDLIAFDDIDFLEKRYYPDINHILVLCENYKNTLPQEIRHSAKVVKAPFILPDEEKPSFQEKPTIAYIGRASYRKGTDIFMKSLSMLYKEYRYFKMLLLGPDGYKDEANNKITIKMENHPSGSSRGKIYFYNHEWDFYNDDSTNGFEFEIKQQVISSPSYDSSSSEYFEEHLKSLWDIYKSIDIVVIPSRYEPYGYVALEALAMGKIVIAAKTGGLIELLDNQKYGILVDITDEEKAAEYFRDAIRWVLGNMSEAKERAAKGQAWVYERYKDDVYKKIAEDMYDKYLTAMFHVDKHKSFDDICQKCRQNSECEQYKSCIRWRPCDKCKNCGHWEMCTMCPEYKLCKSQSKEVSNNNLNYIDSEIPTDVDIFESKSSTNYMTVPKDGEEKYINCPHYAYCDNCNHFNQCEQCRQSYFGKKLALAGNWKDILVTSAYESRRFNREYHDNDNDEDYNMIWEMARWVKQSKSSCPEVRMITHKNLADLITQIKRILPK